MRKIEWSPKLVMGVEEVDEQHRRLLQLTNNLAAAIQTKVADDLMEIVFNELYEYTIFHFDDEERLMKEKSFPGRKEHAKAHEELKEQVLQYKRELAENGKVDPEQVYDFLGNWLIDHIIEKDLMIAEHMRVSQSN